MIKVLLTGSDGFIGKNIYKKYTSFIVSCIEKDWVGELSKEIQLCDVVLHIGAISDTMLQDNNEMMKYNYEFSRVLFDLSEEYGKQVIYASSGANTGENGLPSNSYGWSKYVTEQYGMSKVTNFVALRYMNVYGPGEEHKGNMSSVAYQAWKEGKFKLFPKKPKRDFVYIDDVVDATFYPVFNKVPKGVYEVGTGTARTFEEVLKLMGIPYWYRLAIDIPNGYQFFTQANKDRFMDGWKPKYSLEDGIKKYREYLS